jgi:hypothetical protein
MRIRMKVTAAGSEDGFTSSEYAEGQEYEVSAALAKSFVDAGIAEPVDAKAPRGRARK